VVRNGVNWLPAEPVVPLVTTTDGLVVPTLNTLPPVPTATPAPDWFVGTEISTIGATTPLRVEELILDGQLDADVTCGLDPANVWVWDVTNPATPTLAVQGQRDLISK